MSAAQVIPLMVPSPPMETVEVPTESVQILLEGLRESAAQQRETLRRIDDLREDMNKQGRHLDQQDDRFTEQDEQRKLQWAKTDKIAEAVAVLPDLIERLKVIEKHAPGLVWASMFRQGLIWFGLLVVTGLVTAGAGIAVTWAWAHRHIGPGA